MSKFEETYILRDDKIISNTVTSDSSLSELTLQRQQQIGKALHESSTIAIIGDVRTQIFNPQYLQILDITQLD